MYTYNSCVYRLQSQEQIKSRRMTDALSLMEDILSAEPPPIHTSTHCPSSPRHTKRTPQPRHYSTTKRQPGRGRKNVHTSDSVLLFPTTQHGIIHTCMHGINFSFLRVCVFIMLILACFLKLYFLCIEIIAYSVYLHLKSPHA